jgi:ketosteroid isomerase-like protein
MDDRDPITAVRQRVVLWNQQMDACLIRGDLQGYAAFYADDATIIGYDKRKIQGREAIDRFCLEMTGIKEAKAVVLDVGVGGDLIYQVATSFARWERNGEAGSYLCDCIYVWRKEADGTYRIFLDAYN